MKTKDLISVRVALNDMDTIVELIQLYIAFNDGYKHHKGEFIQFAKDQLEQYGYEHCGLDENNNDYEDYHEKACELFNKWFRPTQKIDGRGVTHFNIGPCDMPE